MGESLRGRVNDSEGYTGNMRCIDCLTRIDNEGVVG